MNQPVRHIRIDADLAGQRIDNFLRVQLKGVPKSLIYRILRKGEVRVNKKRIKPDYKLQGGDEVRVPPVNISEPSSTVPSPRLNRVASLQQQVLYEDEALLVLDKPCGMAVHGGSGLQFGVIEGLRALRPDARFLELVHRLDRDTSGILLVAKKRSMLRALHQQLRDKTIQKEYLCLVRGQWPARVRNVTAPLLKNIQASGERIVRVNADGKPSETRFRMVRSFRGASLISASPVTGRTHQIRVHTQHAGYPIAGDEKYGDAGFDQTMKLHGLHRLFLHAARICFLHPGLNREMVVEAPLDNELQAVLANLDLDKDPL